MRKCGHCDADISCRAPQARFCEDPECHRQRMLAHGRVSYHRHREDIRERQNAAHRARVAAKPKPPPRQCAYCGVQISHRRKWCNLRCRDKARYEARQVHRLNVYAARAQRDCGYVVDPPMTAGQWGAILSATHCHYCTTSSDHIEPDHVVPLSRGGRHRPDNIVASCRRCNRSKRDATPAEWQARIARFGQEYPHAASSENLVKTTLFESG